MDAGGNDHFRSAPPAVDPNSNEASQVSWHVSIWELNLEIRQRQAVFLGKRS
jgi:hypothetical protein